MLGIIGNKFSIGKETYHPFAAELHYFRIDKRYWSICFERIKRAGFRVIATIVPWNLHQDNAKHVDFSGYDDPRRDLIVFLELAREFGFKVILRPGPMVGSQVPYSGLPRALFNDSKVFARDANGGEIALADTFGVKGGFLPSVLSHNFQFHLRNYFKAFIETTKNYVHPRGPIFMVELDYETSFGCILDPAGADYNADVVAEHYPAFLETRYQDIKVLNAAYKEQNESFQQVQPPRRFTELEPKQYVKALDWFRFRQYMLNEYLTMLESIFASFTVEPLLFRSLYYKSGDLLPAYNLVPEDRSPFLGTNVFPDGSYFDLLNKARFLQAEYGFAFASSFISGAAAANPEREEKVAPISNHARRFYLAAAPAAGFKGLNHYMFVDREHWYGAPLRNDGTVTDGYDVVKNFNEGITAIGFEDIEVKPKIALLVNRLYYWIRDARGFKDFGYVGRLLHDTTAGLGRDLTRLRLVYGIRENRDYSTFKDYEVVIVPSTEVMSEVDQEALVEVAKAGKTIIMCGLVPRFDENFKDCQVLAKHFRLKTTADYRVAEIAYKGGSSTSYIYGHIRDSDDSRTKKLAQVDGKLVGICSNRFKGNLYLFTFDVASGGDHHKLAFVESILHAAGQVSGAYCSDPSVNVVFHAGPKVSLLYIVAPPPGELSDGLEAAEKEVIVQLDLRKFGFTAAQVKLTDLLAGEQAVPIKTTAKDLRAGIPLRLHFPDGYIFLVQKR